MSFGQKSINEFYVNFDRTCQDHTFATRTQVGTPSDSERNENGQCLLGKKHKRFYANFDRTCQDHTFAAKTWVGTPGDSQKNENGKRLLGKQLHKRLLYTFWSHLSGSHFSHNDPSCDHKWQQKEWKWKMSTGQKNINDFYVIFGRACQDEIFATRINVGTSSDSQRNENENVCWVKNHKRFLCEFVSHLSGSHFCHKDQSWDPKWQPKTWKWIMPVG